MGVYPCGAQSGTDTVLSVPEDVCLGLEASAWKYSKVIDKDYVQGPCLLILSMPTFSTRAVSLANGTYYICAQTQRTCLTLTDGNEGTTLTTWKYSANDTEQQVVDSR